MKYARAFTGNANATQTKEDGALVWAGIDWDVRVRTPAVIAVADVASAKILASLPPITGIDSLASVVAALPALIATLRTASDAATIASGWTNRVPNAVAIMTAICEGAWAACEGSHHGLAWRTAKGVLDQDKTAAVSIAKADVSVLGRYAARTAAWSTVGANAVKNFAAFSPAAIKPIFTVALAAIAESRAALIRTF
jgi:hypothetical protein